jgi:hypothetical protein
MKQLNILITACLLASCSKEYTPATPASYISVIDDLTDSFALHPAADPILGLYDFQTDKDQAGNFRLVLITDKQLNPIEEIHIDAGTETEKDNINDEVDYREQLVYSFYDAIRKSLTDFHARYAHSSPLEHSECFATISSELNCLANSKASQRTLIVFSDLQENEEAFSCYTERGRNLLHTHPDKVMRLLQKRCPLPNDLSGVTVYFVYNPMNREQDISFSEMAGIYKQLLKERRARVVILATNKYYQP